MGATEFKFSSSCYRLYLSRSSTVSGPAHPLPSPGLDALLGLSMPELPEVETTRRGVAPLVEGLEITAVNVRAPRATLADSPPA